MVNSGDCNKGLISNLEKSLGIENTSSVEDKKIIVENENNNPSGPEDTVVSDMIRRYTAIHGLPHGYNPY